MNRIEDQRGPAEMLEEFQDKFQTPNTPAFWMGLVREEVQETLVAAAELLKEISDVAYVAQGYINANGGLPSQELVDELEKLHRVADLLDAYGPETLKRAQRRVHYNNMSKVHPDGTVKRREDGKVMKPEGYVPVDLSDLVL